MEKEYHRPDTYDEWMDLIENFPTVPRGILDDWKCPDPNCNCGDRGRMLIPKCHSNAAVIAAYVMNRGRIVLSCSECGKPFFAARIAADA